MASSKVEEYEGSIEQGDDSILASPQVAETREELAKGLFGLTRPSSPWADESTSL